MKGSFPISNIRMIDVYYVTQFHSKVWLSLINIRRHKFILQGKVKMSTWHLSYKLHLLFLKLYNIFLRPYNSEKNYIQKDQIMFYNDWLKTNKNNFKAWKICDFIIFPALLRMNIKRNVAWVIMTCWKSNKRISHQFTCHEKLVLKNT